MQDQLRRLELGGTSENVGPARRLGGTSDSEGCIRLGQGTDEDQRGRKLNRKKKTQISRTFGGRNLRF